MFYLLLELDMVSVAGAVAEVFKWIKFYHMNDCTCLAK